MYAHLLFLSYEPQTMRMYSMHASFSEALQTTDHLPFQQMTSPLPA